MTSLSDAEPARQVLSGSAHEVSTSVPDQGLHAVHESFRHEALLWSDEHSFLDHAVPFVREGLGLDQPVLVATIPERLTLLRDALGGDAVEVCFIDMAELGANPARIIPLWRDFVRSTGALDGRPIRGIGEPLWPGRRVEEVRECQLHEALLNEAVSGSVPLWLLCPYDVRGLADDVLDQVGRSHPNVLGSRAPHRAYAGPAHARMLFAEDLPGEPGHRLLHRHDVGPDTLDDLRAAVAAVARPVGLGAERTNDLVLAVCEVATNAIAHGGGSATTQVWRNADALVVEVHDDGLLDDPMVGRRTPDLTATSGRGMWMVNRLCDLVQVRSGARGTTVRLFTWLDDVGEQEASGPEPMDGRVVSGAA